MKTWELYYRRLLIENRIEFSKLGQTQIKQENEQSVEPITTKEIKIALKSIKNE